MPLKFKERGGGTEYYYGDDERISGKVLAKIVGCTIPTALGQVKKARIEWSIDANEPVAMKKWGIQVRDFPKFIDQLIKSNRAGTGGYIATFPELQEVRTQENFSFTPRVNGAEYVIYEYTER